MVPIEGAMLRSLPWLAAGLMLSIPLLIVDPLDDLYVWFIGQLIVLVAFGLALVLVLLPFTSDDWFTATGWSFRTRLIASGASIVVLSTGVVGLVTLASSAAIGYDPSTQFLQLLSALDVAWVVGAVVVGASRAWGKVWAVVAGGTMGIVCVWSIWRYLDIVGFGTGGEWLMSGDDLMRLVIPFDIAAAIIAIGIFVYGVSRVAQPTEQPSPQS